jgi:hypothetical protein
MKTIKHEVELERSVKIILGAFAFGIILNAFLTPIGQELFGITQAKADWIRGWPSEALSVYIVNK